MKAYKLLTDDFFVGNFGSVKATDEIVKMCAHNFKDENLHDAGVGGKGVNHSIRNCRIAGISKDRCQLITEGLGKIIMNVNKMQWNMDLEHIWEAHIQYTRYIGEGHFYNWHRDAYVNDENSVGHKRKLTIVYCLSYKKDYTGGEFEVKREDNSVYTRKFDYGDFIVFPAYKLHRVKPLKKGTRTTLVGWYM